MNSSFTPIGGGTLSPFQRQALVKAAESYEKAGFLWVQVISQPYVVTAKKPSLSPPSRLPRGNGELPTG
jgi:hypothetical protein